MLYNKSHQLAPKLRIKIASKLPKQNWGSKLHQHSRSGTKFHRTSLDERHAQKYHTNLTLLWQNDYTKCATIKKTIQKSISTHFHPISTPIHAVFVPIHTISTRISRYFHTIFAQIPYNFYTISTQFQHSLHTNPTWFPNIFTQFWNAAPL